MRHRQSIRDDCAAHEYSIFHQSCFSWLAPLQLDGSFPIFGSSLHHSCQHNYRWILWSADALGSNRHKASKKCLASQWSKSLSPRDLCHACCIRFTGRSHTRSKQRWVIGDVLQKNTLRQFTRYCNMKALLLCISFAVLFGVTSLLTLQMASVFARSVPAAAPIAFPAALIASALLSLKGTLMIRSIF